MVISRVQRGIVDSYNFDEIQGIETPEIHQQRPNPELHSLLGVDIHEVVSSNKPKIYSYEAFDENGSDIRTESVLAWNNFDFDPVFVSWLREAEQKIASVSDPQQRLIKLTKYVRESFSISTTKDGWKQNPWLKFLFHRYLNIPYFSGSSYIKGKYRMGDLLRTRSGLCRHLAVALAELLKEYGFKKVYYVIGELKVSNLELGQEAKQGARSASLEPERHAWVEVDLGDAGYLICDPTIPGAFLVERSSMTENRRIVRRDSIVAEFNVELGTGQSKCADVAARQLDHIETLVEDDEQSLLFCYHRHVSHVKAEFTPSINWFFGLQ